MDICILILSFQVIGNFDAFCDPLRLDEISDSVTADFLQPDRKRHQGALKDPEVEGLIFSSGPGGILMPKDCKILLQNPRYCYQLRLLWHPRLLNRINIIHTINYIHTKRYFFSYIFYLYRIISYETILSVELKLKSFFNKHFLLSFFN